MAGFAPHHSSGPNAILNPSRKSFPVISKPFGALALYISMLGP